MQRHAKRVKRIRKIQGNQRLEGGMESKNENKRKKEGKEDDKQRGKKSTDQRRMKGNKQKNAK